MIGFLKEKINALSESRKLFLKNLFSVFFFRIIQKVMILLTLYIFVRSVSQESFGHYNFILSLVALLSIFALPGLGNAVMQSVARGYHGTYLYALRFMLTGSVIAGLILILSGCYFIFLTTDILLGYGFLIVGLLIPFDQGLNSWKNLYKGKEDFKTISKQGIILSFARCFLIITSLLCLPGNYLLPLFFYFFASATQNIFFTIHSLKSIKTDGGIEEESFSYGLKSTFYSSFNTVANHIDKILIFTYLSPISLAIYIASEKFPELIKSFVQDIATVISPRFAKMEGYTKKVDNQLTFFSLFLGLMIVIFSLTALPYLILFLFGEDYSSSVPYAQALVCSVAIGNAAQLRSRYISSKLDIKSFKSITIRMSAVRIVASLICIPFLGIWGAVLSAFIYRIAMVFIVWHIIKNRYLNT